MPPPDNQDRNDVDNMTVENASKLCNYLAPMLANQLRGEFHKVRNECNTHASQLFETTSTRIDTLEEVVKKDIGTLRQRQNGQGRRVLKLERHRWKLSGAAAMLIFLIEFGKRLAGYFGGGH